MGICYSSDNIAGDHMYTYIVTYDQTCSRHNSGKDQLTAALHMGQRPIFQGWLAIARSSVAFSWVSNDLKI